MSIFSSVRDAIFGKKDDILQEMPQFIPTPPTEMPGFSEAHIQLIERNHQVESKDDMLNYVEQSDLSVCCKECFKNLILNIYDRNLIFADNSQTNGVEIAYLETLLDIYPTVWASSTKNDRLKPCYFQILSDVKMQLRARLTRTNGPDRERIIVTKNVNSTEVLMKRAEARK